MIYIFMYIYKYIYVQEDRLDPMIYIFPRMTKCTFHKFGTSGEVNIRSFIILFIFFSIIHLAFFYSSYQFHFFSFFFFYLYSVCFLFLKTIRSLFSNSLFLKYLICSRFKIKKCRHLFRSKFFIKKTISFNCNKKVKIL